MPLALDEHGLIEADRASPAISSGVDPSEFMDIGLGDATLHNSASSLGRSLGVSRQAAAKSIAALEELGYVERQTDPRDAR
jgi:DNA-binding MarR family transcriptional regulator